MRRLPALTAAAALAAATLVLTACTDASQQPAGSDGASDEASAEASFDPSTVEVDEEIAALLPKEIADKGTLTVGSDTAYAPAEFIDADGKTPVGFDIDTITAVAAVLGLDAEVQSAAFDGIIPAIGSKYDVGHLGVHHHGRAHRRGQHDQLRRRPARSTASPRATPRSFDPENLCGTTIGVQTSTIQDDELTAATEQCEKDGEEPIDVVRYESQADVTTNLVGGKLQAMYADSPITAYAVEQTSGEVETVGDDPGRGALRHRRRAGRRGADRGRAGRGAEAHRRRHPRGDLRRLGQRGRRGGRGRAEPGRVTRPPVHGTCGPRHATAGTVHCPFQETSQRGRKADVTTQTSRRAATRCPTGSTRGPCRGPAASSRRWSCWCWPPWRPTR